MTENHFTLAPIPRGIRDFMPPEGGCSWLTRGYRPTGYIRNSPVVGIFIPNSLSSLLDCILISEWSIVPFLLLGGKKFQRLEVGAVRKRRIFNLRLLFLCERRFICEAEPTSFVPSSKILSLNDS